MPADAARDGRLPAGAAWAWAARATITGEVRRGAVDGLSVDREGGPYPHCACRGDVPRAGAGLPYGEGHLTANGSNNGPGHVTGPHTGETTMQVPLVIVGLSLIIAGAACAQDGLVAHWTCDEGQGEVLADKSGNDNQGTIHGAKWVRSGDGYALQFDGADDYVDCGSGPSLDITGPLTVQLWAQPTAANRGEPGIAGKFFESYALTYYGNGYFYISSGGNNVSGPLEINTWSHIVGTFDGGTMRFYVNGIEVTTKPSRFDTVKQGGRFTIGCIIGDAAAADPNLRNTAFFPGLVDDVRVHNRALSQREVLECYNEGAEGKGLAPFDTSLFGRLILDPFFYPDEREVVVSVNSRWVQPVPRHAAVVLELAEAGATEALQTQTVNASAVPYEDEVTYSLADLPHGEYEVRGFVRQMKGIIEAEDIARKSEQVNTQQSDWLEGKVDLRGGWVEYDVDLPAGEYHLAVLAARIRDAGGIRCTVDGKEPVEASLNGTEGGTAAVWERAEWERIGRYTLTGGPHTLRVEAMPVTGQDGKQYGFYTYIDAFALEPTTEQLTTLEEAQSIRFTWPPPPAPPVPSQQRQTVGALPPAATPPAYQATIAPGGGIEVTVAGKRFRIESSYSYPNGGFNRLTATDQPDTAGEAGWRISLPERADTRRSVNGAGSFYNIERHIELEPTRVLVRDTIRNITDDVLGVMLSNSINLQGVDGASVTQMSNPTIFAAQGEAGVGLIALDDLYQLQLTTAYSDGLAEVRDDHFGLDAGASYTVEWAIYPTAAPVAGQAADYYDFINQVRRDEGLSGSTVEGGFAWMPFSGVPEREYAELRNARYFSTGTPWRPVDDPQVSIEGIEFMEHPQECARIKAQFEQVKREYPGARVMIHVAHGLYCTNRPEELFPDSRALHPNGSQLDYGGGNEDYYANYWSRERFADGWRWWIFYPTPENSFGRAMLKAMEYMMDEMGATAMWADGYISGYVRGEYTYDRWDGHSVTIDPQTKLVTQKKCLAPYAALPVLRDTIRLIADRGGVLITNGSPGPRSLWREQYLTSNETGGGDARPIGGLHLGRSVTPLGNPSALKTERDIYRDILNKLDFGALYWWYGERGLLTHKTLVEHMYPITFESIHEGTVRGRERIVTKRSGVYGWPEDRSLHAVYLYDARGALTGHAFLTTVDAAGVRTQVDLDAEQSAAIVKVPITLTSETPVNVRVLQYDADGMHLELNGTGAVTITIGDGDYAVGAETRHAVTVNGKPVDAVMEGGALGIKIELDGQCALRVRGARG